MNIQSIKNHVTDFANAVVDQPWHDKGFYAQWSAQTYYYAGHTTRLLAMAASRFSMEQDDLHIRFLTHAREETRHERLSVKDLKGLGHDISQFQELSATAALYQIQYYWIGQVHPLSFMGFITSLEGMATLAGPSIFKKVVNAHGKPASNFVAVHGQEDPEHVEKAYAILEKLPKDVMPLVFRNLELSCSRYIAMLDEIKAVCGGAQWKRAA